MLDKREMLLPGALDADLGAALAHYREHGWARIGRVADDHALDALRTRADEIMLGKVKYPGLFFQIDSATGDYDDLTYGKGYEGPSLAYRKIEKLEKDPLFRAWLENPLFGRIAHAVLGDHGIAIYRAVLFAKGAAGGSHLPWHQDAGVFWGLDRDPCRPARERGGRGRQRKPHARSRDPPRRRRSRQPGEAARRGGGGPPAPRRGRRGAADPQPRVAPLREEPDGTPEARLHGLLPRRTHPMHANPPRPTRLRPRLHRTKRNGPRPSA